jgi:Zn-dependent peptidase ImmA (M78 family)
MEKIAINPQRLQFCCNMLGIDIQILYKELSIAKTTFDLAIRGEEALSIKQLEKIANFFNRSLLFFINPNPVKEELIYSPQFRTINSQKPIYSRKINAFIENVEQHRNIYLNLLQELDMPIVDSWKKDISFNGDVINFSSVVREFLELQENLDFEQIREKVESKGIIVIVSNGYNGKWQIDKDTNIRGFSLYYDTLPIIAIKKQHSKEAQAFTLMHELAHLLIHKNSMIDENKDFYSYNGKEKEANQFASNVLIPDNLITDIDLDKLQNLSIEENDTYLKEFKQKWCVSGDAILYRLFIDKKITKVHYKSYKTFKENQYQEQQKEEQRKKDLGQKKDIPRVYRHREPINMFGKNYVATVLDAMQNKNITLNKASSYLDNLKIKTLHKLEADFV